MAISFILSYIKNFSRHQKCKFFKTGDFLKLTMRRSSVTLLLLPIVLQTISALRIFILIFKEMSLSPDKECVAGNLASLKELRVSYFCVFFFVPKKF